MYSSGYRSTPHSVLELLNDLVNCDKIYSEMCTEVTTNDQDVPVPENEIRCPEKIPLSLEVLETIGITENNVDAAILTLEKLSQLLAVGKCEWVKVNRKEKIVSKLNRLKWATKKFSHGLEYKIQYEKSKLISKEISKRSGICRLRKEKGLRMKRIYEEKNLPKICPSNLKIPNNDEENVASDSNYPTAIKCYICKTRFTKVHTFYDQMCPPCAEFNYSKRSQTADLTGKVALVTGGRIKIGYEVVLKLLRCGISRVITTTRFPQDAAKRYANESDYELWKDRLDIYGLDLRFLGTVEKFCAYIIETYPRLDILIQNAAQTVRRPPAFFAHLIREEAESLEFSPLVKTFQNNSMLTLCTNSVTSGQLALNNPFETSAVTPSNDRLYQCSSSALSSQLMIHPDDHKTEETEALFPPDQFDGDHQQIDLRLKNSWLLEAPEVETAELVEVSIVNSMAPFVILSKLSSLLKNSVKISKTDNPENCGWVILVSAMEGQFNRQKSTQHPHTNCAKASLNMLARTSGEYYAQFGIFMNSVDTGWVTDEVPVRARQQYKGKLADFVPPLDEIDGAARILDPIFQTINCGVKEFGKFYKDYKKTVW